MSRAQCRQTTRFHRGMIIRNDNKVPNRMMRSYDSIPTENLEISRMIKAR